MPVFFSNDVGSGSREHDFDGPFTIIFLSSAYLLDEKCLLLEAKETLCLHHGYYYY